MGQSSKLVERLLKMRCERTPPGKAASWFFLTVGFHHMLFGCSVHLTTFLHIAFRYMCRWGPAETISACWIFNGRWKWKPDRRQKEIVRRHLTPRQESRTPETLSCSSADRNGILLEQTSDEGNALAFVWKFPEKTSIDPLSTVFSCFWPVCCGSCIHCNSSHWSSTCVVSPVCVWRREVTVIWSSNEQLVSFRIQSGANWF